MTYTDEQQKLIEEMKAKVIVCEKQHASWKKWCDKIDAGDVWEFAELAIEAKGNYYRAEIVRAKHNIARHMLGRNPEPASYPGIWMEAIEKQLASIPRIIQDLTNDKYEARRTENKGAIGECWGLNYKLGCELFETFLKNFKDFADWGKRRTYGGSV